MNAIKAFIAAVIAAIAALFTSTASATPIRENRECDVTRRGTPRPANHAEASFIAQWESLMIQGRSLTWNPRWQNGTGYLDGLADSTAQPYGHYAAMDQWGRKIIVWSDGHDQVVLFQRYVGHPLLVANASCATTLSSIPNEQDVLNFLLGKDEIFDYSL